MGSYDNGIIGIYSYEIYVSLLIYIRAGFIVGDLYNRRIFIKKPPLFFFFWISNYVFIPAEANIHTDLPVNYPNFSFGIWQAANLIHANFLFGLS